MRAGIDKVAGYVTSFEGLPVSVPQVITSGDLDSFDAAVLLDVRAVNEHNEGHVPGATQLHGGRVLRNMDKLPQHGTTRNAPPAPTNPVATPTRIPRARDVTSAALFQGMVDRTLPMAHVLVTAENVKPVPMTPATVRILGEMNFPPTRPVSTRDPATIRICRSKF